jgi:hypothetical protein
MRVEAEWMTRRITLLLNALTHVKLARLFANEVNSEAMLLLDQ